MIRASDPRHPREPGHSRNAGDPRVPGLPRDPRDPRDPMRRGAPADARIPTARRALAVMALPALLLTLLLIGFAMLHGGRIPEEQVRRALPLLIAFNHLVVLTALARIVRLERRSMEDIGWTVDRVRDSIIVAVFTGLAAGLALYLFKEVVLDSVQALLAGNRPTFTSLFRFRPPSEGTAMLVIATTVVMVEESVYRGYGLDALDRRWPRGYALAAMALLFGLLHWGNGALAIVFTGVLGLGFGGLFLWRRSLFIPFIAHASYNALVILT
jgi:membrane protease YdiL (CAAX protease family)